MYITWTGVQKSISGYTLYFYAENLATKLTSAKSIKNYLGANQLYHNHLGLHGDNLSHFKYQLMPRALPLTMRHFPVQKLLITPEILDNICNICDQIGDLGTVLKVGFTLSNYGFLRQSNITPPSPAAFDLSRHTTHADVTQQPPGLLVRLKWSKTHQAPGVPALIPISSLPGHRTDPLAEFMHMLHVIPTRYPADPLLLLPSWRPVTSRYLQRAFRCILTPLGFPVHAYLLHSMRPGGATNAVRAGADFLDVKRHGLLQSDAFWEYIANREISDSPVATALSNAMTDSATHWPDIYPDIYHLKSHQRPMIFACNWLSLHYYSALFLTITQFGGLPISMAGLFHCFIALKDNLLICLFTIKMSLPPNWVMLFLCTVIALFTLIC